MKTKLGDIFSCIYKHEKEQVLRLMNYSHVFTRIRKNKY